MVDLLTQALREKAIEEYFKLPLEQVKSSLSLQELIKTDSNLHHDTNCIHNKGKSKCVNCHVRSYLEFLIEESEQ